MAAKIRLRTGQYRKYVSLKGLTTQAAQAAALGVSEPTVGRVVTGKTGPGEQFIAGCLAAFPELDFSDLFEVVTDDEPVAV